MANSNTLGQVLDLGSQAQSQAQGALPDLASKAVQGLQTGMQLAQSQQQMEVQKQQVAQMQDQLDTAKVNKLTGYLNTLARTSPTIAKRMIPAMSNSLQQAGISHDPNILEATASDDEYRKRVLALTPTMGQLTSDPAARQSLLSAFGDIGEFDKGLSTLSEAQNQQTQAGLKTAMMQNTAEIAKGNQETKRYAADAAAQAARDRMGASIDVKDQKIHDQVVNRVLKDTDKQLTQYNNLQNAISNFNTPGITPTTESFNEMQQAVRANLGIKGSSTGVERSNSFMDSIGMKAAEVAQFLSMSPQDFQKYGGTPFADHVTSLAQNEMNNVKSQMQRKAQLQYIANKSFYNKHPQLKDDLLNFMDAQGQGVGEAPNPSAPQNQPGATPVAPVPMSSAPAKPATSAAAPVDLTAKVTAARSHQYTDAQIAAQLKTLNYKQSDIDKALAGK